MNTQDETNMFVFKFSQEEIVEAKIVLVGYLRYMMTHPPKDEKGVNHVEAVRRFVEEQQKGLVSFGTLPALL